MTKQRPAADSAPPRLIPAGATLRSVTETISNLVLRRHTSRGWIIGFLISFLLLNVLLVSVVWLFAFGVGVWGINIPVAWGFAIVNFVWWIGIGHAGTLISAILLLVNQEWRTSINRFAEAMTLFAVACAGLFPLLHLGRPKFFYWLIPYPAGIRWCFRRTLPPGQSSAGSRWSSRSQSRSAACTGSRVTSRSIISTRWPSSCWLRASSVPEECTDCSVEFTSWRTR